MKPKFLLSVLWLVTAALAVAQKAAPSAEHSSAVAQDELKQVLAQMNHAAAGFKSAKADFQFDYYTKAVDEHDIQKGRIYCRRSGKDVDVAINVESPVPKSVLYKDEKVSLYEPRIDQVTEKSVGKSKADVDAVLNLGFGGSGEELMKSFDVAMEGWETLDGVKTARLHLVGKSDDLKKLFTKAILWVDPERDVPLKQQFFESTGDYRLNHYTAIVLNTKLSNDVFRLKTTSKTKFVRPQ
jgi:outer membrane lipoprotein-sorting protein